MQTLFLKEYDFNEKQSFIEKLNILYKRLFNILEIKELDDSIICSVPICEKNNEKKRSIIAKKICNKFFNDKQKIKNIFLRNPWKKHNYIVNKVVLSNSISKFDEIRQEMRNYKVNILNGKWLFKYLIVDILDFLNNNYNIELKTQNVALLIENCNNLNMGFITLIAKRVKRLCIITSNLSKFRYIEEKLYNEYGIAIEVSNNRRKSLAKIDLIINIDFKGEMINKYKISNNALIINVSENKMMGKRFKLIDNYKIEFVNNKLFEENNLYDYFNNEILYESLIYRKDNLYNILNQLELDKVKIVKLLGNYEQKNIEKPLDKIEKLS